VQLLGDAYEVGQVRAAIVRGLASRRFVAEGEQPGAVVARFERDGKQARVAIEYTELRYSIRLLASNMDSAAASGAPAVDATYFEWTHRLDRAIQEELRRIQKDSAAAARAERDYQLMLEQAKAGGGQSGGGGDVAALLAPALLKAVPTTSVDIKSKTVSRH
jgi:hypothetical protein